MRASRIFYIALIVLWIFIPLAAPYKIIFLGFIAVYLAFHNFLIQRLAMNKNVQSNKNDFMFEKFGPIWGSRLYTLIFILAPFIIGVYIIINGIIFAIRIM